MASQLPVITQLSPTPTVDGIIDELIAFDWGSANLHNLDFSGTDGFVTSPVADPGFEGGATDWQVSVRKDGSDDLMIGIEPMGTLTAVGGTGGPPADDSLAFNENTILASQIAANWGANSLFWHWQVNNCWGVIVTNDNVTPTFFVDGLYQLGKMFRPGSPAYAAKVANGRAGRMGLGYLIGLPDQITSSTIINSMWGGNARSRVLVSIDFNGALAATASEWERPGGAIPISSTSADLIVPTPQVLLCGVNDANASSQTLGFLNYISADTTTEQTGSRWPEGVGGTQAQLYLSDISSGAVRQLLLWLEGQSPF